MYVCVQDRSTRYAHIYEMKQGTGWMYRVDVQGGCTW